MVRGILRGLDIRGQREEKLANGWQLLMGRLPGLLTVRGAGCFRRSSGLAYSIVSYRLRKTRTGVTAEL